MLDQFTEPAASSDVVGVLGERQHAPTGDQLRQHRSEGARQGQVELLAKVTGSGIDLITDEPDQALDLLTDVDKQLGISAQDAKVNPTVIAPLMAQTIAGLDRRQWVVPVASSQLYQFKPANGAAAIDLSQMVRGPDGVPYVIDRSTKTVYLTNLKTGTATVVAKNGTKNKAGTVAQPRYLAVGGQDLLILDSKNIVGLAPGRRQGKGHADQGDARGLRVAR